VDEYLLTTLDGFYKTECPVVVPRFDGAFKAHGCLRRKLK